MSHETDMKQSLLAEMGSEMQTALVNKAYKLESDKDDLNDEINEFFAVYGHTGTTALNAFSDQNPDFKKHFLWELTFGKHLNYKILKKILDFVRENPRQSHPPELMLNDSMVRTMMYHFTRMELGEQLHVISLIHTLATEKKETP